MKKIGLVFKWLFEKLDEIFSLESIYSITSLLLYIDLVDDFAEDFINFTNYQKLVSVSLSSLIVSSFFITPYVISIKKLLENKDNDKK